MHRWLTPCSSCGDGKVSLIFSLGAASNCDEVVRNSVGTLTNAGHREKFPTVPVLRDYDDALLVFDELRALVLIGKTPLFILVGIRLEE